MPHRLNDYAQGAVYSHDIVYSYVIKPNKVRTQEWSVNKTSHLFCLLAPLGFEYELCSRNYFTKLTCIFLFSLFLCSVPWVPDY